MKNIILFYLFVTISLSCSQQSSKTTDSNQNTQLESTQTNQLINDWVLIGSNSQQSFYIILSLKQDGIFEKNTYINTPNRNNSINNTVETSSGTYTFDGSTIELKYSKLPCAYNTQSEVITYSIIQGRLLINNKDTYSPKSQTKLPYFSDFSFNSACVTKQIEKTKRSIASDSKK